MMFSSVQRLNRDKIEGRWGGGGAGTTGTNNETSPHLVQCRMV